MLKILNINSIRIFFIQFNASWPRCAQVSSRPVAHPQHLLAIGFKFLDAQPADALQLGQALSEAGDEGLYGDYLHCMC